MIAPEKAVLRASKWCYGGVWRFITKWLRVPEKPPFLVGADDVDVLGFRPAEGFLRYLKFAFWIGLVLFDGAVFLAWIGLLVAFPLVGLILAPLIWAVMILPDIVAYVALHLRYDTTWYVLSDRSMRIRRGIWKIHETTITYDNIQNVSIRQGPLQRYFGIFNIMVETAGGGSSGGEAGSGSSNTHCGRLEGIDNPQEIRSLILRKWSESKSSGLGDEQEETRHEGLLSPRKQTFTDEQVQLLEQIRDVADQLTRE